jgi:hypothetical protein
MREGIRPLLRQYQGGELSELFENKPFSEYAPNRMSIGTQSDLITTIVQKLWRNPSFLPEFTALHHGSYKPVNVTEVDGKPIIDTYVIFPGTNITAKC